MRARLARRRAVASGPSSTYARRTYLREEPLNLTAASPFAAIERERWRTLGAGEASIGYDELAGLSGLGEPVAPEEVNDV